MSFLDWLAHTAESVGREIHHEAEEVTHAIQQVEHEAVSEVHDTLGEVSSVANQIGDTLQNIDETIEAVPVLGTLYDFTPLHTATSLGGEWAHVTGEAAGDIEGEMEGRHADWGHLAHQVGSASFDTGLAVASSYIGGAVAGRVLGKVGGAAARLGAKTVGRDVAGQLGAGAERSMSRRGADWVAHTTFGGAIGSGATQPAAQAGHRIGGGEYGGVYSFDRSVGRRGSSGEYGHDRYRRESEVATRRESGHHNFDDQPRHRQTGSVSHISQGVNPPRDRNTTTGHLGGHISEPVQRKYEPPHVTYSDQMNMQKMTERGVEYTPPPSNAIYDAPLPNQV